MSCKLSALLVWMFVVSRALCSCPSSCICVGGRVSCPPNTITSIPSSISNSTSTMTLNQNQFSNPRLSPANFSTFRSLEELYLQDCGIQHIDRGTFSGMSSLSLLDLSLNQLQTIASGAFSSLRLGYLFLSDNPSLQLSPSVLSDLQTEVLDLAGCGLQDIDPTLFTPMIGTLRKLSLQRNEIKRFSRAMLGVFASLKKLRFDDNPLACDCHMLWLKEFYDLKKDEIRDAENENDKEEPRCSSPATLQGDYFSSLSAQDFICEKPTINTTVHINDSMSILRCEAFGYPPANITWYLPNGNNRVYPAHWSTDSTVGELNVPATSDTTTRHHGLYKCVASNEAGNVSFDLNLELPISAQIADVPCETKLVTTTGQEVVIPANQPPEAEEGQTLLQKKYFSLVDLLSAVLGTFVGTLMLSVIILHFCVYKKKKARAAASHYSDSSSPMSDYADCLKNEGTRPSSANPAHQMMLHSGTSPHCIQNRPLPNKPYARVYDETHYMSSPLNDRDDIENSVISPYGHLNAAGSVVSPVNTQARFPCEACRSQCDSHTNMSCRPIHSK